MATRADLLKNFKGNPPASREAVDELEISKGMNLPTDYRDFLAKNNGGEGFVGERNYLILWKVEDLQPFNKDYEVANYLDNVLLIGSSGGGDAYGFDTEKKPWQVIRVPFIGMEPKVVESVAPTFYEFLQVLASDISS